MGNHLTHCMICIPSSYIHVMKNRQNFILILYISVFERTVQYRILRIRFRLMFDLNVYVPYQDAGSAGRASSGTSLGRPRRQAAARGAGSAEKTARVTAKNSTVARGPSPYHAERTTRGSSTQKRVNYSLTLYST